MPNCNFAKAWVGRCTNTVEREGDCCSEHVGKTCHSCGAPAIMECEETMGPFVCGCYLCANCEHTTYPNGCNSDKRYKMKMHRKRVEQLFKPWYEEGAEEHNAETLKRLGGVVS